MVKYVRAYTTWNAIKYTGENVGEVRDAVAHLAQVWEQDDRVYIVCNNQIIGEVNPYYSPWVMYVSPDTTSSGGPFIEDGAEAIYVSGPNYDDPDSPSPRSWTPVT